MELCDRWGIPHSQFRGGDGTWTRLDRAKALAYRAFQRLVCPQCGTREEEWDEDAGGDDEAYVAVTVRCRGCQDIADKQAEVPTSGSQAHGVKVALVPASVHAAQTALRSLTRGRTATD